MKTTEEKLDSQLNLLDQTRQGQGEKRPDKIARCERSMRNHNIKIFEFEHQLTVLKLARN